MQNEKIDQNQDQQDQKEIKVFEKKLKEKKGKRDLIIRIKNFFSMKDAKEILEDEIFKKILDEKKTVKKMAKFYGLTERAIFYKKRKYFQKVNEKNEAQI